MNMPKILTKALRQYQHNDCSGFLSGYDCVETEKIVVGLEQRIQESEAREEILITALEAIMRDTNNSRVSYELLYYGCQGIAKEAIESQPGNPRFQAATKYQNLIMAVQRKFPGESRYETALRYISEAESCSQEGLKEIEGGA